jgi:hypothetical protein
MKKSKLDFEKYNERLKSIFPQYSERELKEYLILRMDFWEMILENYENIDFNKIVKN